jgi:hypothetical protein
MGITIPYFRICRPFTDGSYLRNINDTYFRDPRYATDRIDLIRGYHLLEKELLRICDFVEPADANVSCYSHQLFALLLRASTEFEANARAILTANGYRKSRNWNVNDYYRINAATRLAEYTVTLPIWTGSHRRVQPFSSWTKRKPLTWYQDYNAVKHCRASAFSSASLGNAVTAVAAVFAVVFAQFNVLAFDPHHDVYMYSENSGVLSHDSCLLHIELPTSWPSVERYDFDWDSLAGTHAPFQQYPFGV